MSDLIEEICAGAVVGDIGCPVENDISLPRRCSVSDDRGCFPCNVEEGSVPIAHVGGAASLAEKVARRLLEGRWCGTCECVIACVCGPNSCPDLPFKNPPFAAAVITRGGETEWVLASGGCEACVDMYPRCETVAQPKHERYPCARCQGARARTNVLAIARRYDPEATGTPRLARFKVRS
jgi:hypothetical protein